MNKYQLIKYQIHSVHHTDVPPITEVISAKVSTAYFGEKAPTKEYPKSPINVNFSAHSGLTPLNNASDERHVKFDLEDDFNVQSEAHENKDTKAEDVAITMHPE